MPSTYLHAPSPMAARVAAAAPPAPPPVVAEVGRPPGADWLTAADQAAGHPLVRGWVLSTVFHMSLLLVLGAALVAEPVFVPTGMEITASYDESARLPSETLEIELVRQPQPFEVPRAESLTAAAGAALAADEIVVPIELTIFESSGPGIGGAAEGNSLLGKGEQAGLQGEARYPSTEFFGLSAHGDKFVFVVDCSGSMGDGRRFERAVDELEKSIRRLKDYQQFYVIFFNHFARPMPEPGLVAATPENIDKAVAWIRQVTPGGSTDPSYALQQALRLKPHAIFLLSDGVFNPLVSHLLPLRRARNAVPVHSVAFVDRSGERVLKAIAGRTGGMYRFVE